MSKVLDDGYWREYPWTVKADPDTAARPSEGFQVWGYTGYQDTDVGFRV